MGYESEHRLRARVGASIDGIHRLKLVACRIQTPPCLVANILAAAKDRQSGSRPLDLSAEQEQSRHGIACVGHLGTWAVA